MSERVRNMRGFTGERGVAMVTVLFTAAVLTVVSSTAAFVTIQEFRAAGNDQRGAQALSYAEAGVDRLMLLIRGDVWKWADLNASGCDDPDGDGDPTNDDDADVFLGSGANDDLVFVEGTISGTNGIYRAELRHPDCPATTPSPRLPQRMFVFGEGEHPAARRVVQQGIEIRPKGLPVGLYASSTITAGGTGNETEVQRISLITAGDVANRDRIGFEGNDPYYTKDDFYGNGDTTAIPAAAHSVKNLFCKKAANCGGSTTEHLEPDSDLNCTANPQGTPTTQSAWDGSVNGGDEAALDAFAGCAGSGKPPRTTFTNADLLRVAPNPALEDDDRRAMENRAKSGGLYCDYTLATPMCTIAGGPQFKPPSTWTGTQLVGLPDHFIAFFEFPTAGSPEAAKTNDRTVDWRASWSPLCGTPSKSAIFLIPDGSITFRGAGGGGNSEIAGAIFAEKGHVDVAAGIRFHGTIIAHEITMQAGSSFLLDECWLDNMPIAFLRVIPISWAEVDS